MLVKGGAFVADPWRHLDDEEPVPEDGAVTLSLKRWQRERDGLLGRNTLRLGVRLPNDAAPSELAADLDRLELVALDFPKFTDGRAYTQARLLRQRFGFRGELRATGNVLRDQLLFMQRCGIDAFAVTERAVSEHWLTAFADFDVFYQPAEDQRPWAMARRLDPPGFE